MHDGAEPAAGQLWGQERDGAGDDPRRAQAPKPPGDRRRRQGDLTRELVGGAGVIALNQLEKLEIEPVEHPANCAKFWQV